MSSEHRLASPAPLTARLDTQAKFGRLAGVELVTVGP
jgi:hypothetical protein